ncbi:unnamed protein product [Calypogeia fissa]
MFADACYFQVSRGLLLNFRRFLEKVKVRILNLTVYVGSCQRRTERNEEEAEHFNLFLLDDGWTDVTMCMAMWVPFALHCRQATQNCFQMDGMMH